MTLSGKSGTQGDGGLMPYSTVLWGVRASSFYGIEGGGQGTCMKAISQFSHSVVSDSLQPHKP